MSVLTKAVRRLNADMKEYRAAPIEGTAIYQLEDPLTRLYVAIAGAKDSAYEDGIYFFQFDFPDTYPNDPPKGKFLNWQNSKIRMHPNLYVDGKLCLSLLGTWSGPSWTSAMSISTIILSIQSIMDENPLCNEPGYDKNTGSDQHQKYHRIVQYYNYRDFVGKSIQSIYNPEITKGYDYVPYFRDFIVDYYLKNQQRVSDEIDKLVKIFPTQVHKTTTYQACAAVIDYPTLKKEWEEMKQLFAASL